MSFSFVPSSSQQSLFSASIPSQSSSFGDLGPFSTSAFGNQSLSPDGATLDANSPELFKLNLKLVQTHIEHVASLARTALNGVERAYGLHESSAQTTATLQTLRQSIIDLQALLVSSGVGALPLLSPEVVDPPTEAQVLEQTTKAFNDTWVLRARNQEAAAMVANLLSAPDLPTTHR